MFFVEAFRTKSRAHKGVSNVSVDLERIRLLTLFLLSVLQTMTSVCHRDAALRWRWNGVVQSRYEPPRRARGRFVQVAGYAAATAGTQATVRNDLEYNAYVVRRSPDLALASTEGLK